MKHFTSYEEALAYILEAIDLEKTTKYKYDIATFNLDRVHRILAHMGNPHKGLQMVHIAGTKGKGSTAIILAQILTAHGLRTGLFTSPHLVDLRERITIDGQMIPEHALIGLVNRLAPYVEQERQKSLLDSPTFFEILTALGFAYFNDEHVDSAVIEVGLGGRLDSTNVIMPLVSVITRIDFDHMDKLGSTLSQIAKEKAGIIKSDVPVVCAPQPKEAMEVITAQAREIGAPLIPISDVSYTPAPKERGLRFSFTGWRRSFENLFLALLGEHQAVNAATALVALEVLEEKGLFQMNESTLREALAHAYVPGRVEVVSENPLIVLDSAHNPLSARALQQTLKEYFAFDHMTLVIGMVKDKDIAGFLREIIPLANTVITTQVDNPRAAEAEYLRQEIEKMDFTGHVEAIHDPITAIHRARALTGPRDLLCITGSFYLAGKIKEILGKK